MIYPPINELVDKTGNRYKLVIAAAKRAREISREEKETETEDRQEISSIDQRIKERSERMRRDGKTDEKPIIRALDEIMHDEIYITNADESGNDLNADGRAMPSENDIIEDFDTSSYSSHIIDDDITFSGNISENDLKELIESEFALKTEEDLKEHESSEEDAG